MRYEFSINRMAQWLARRGTTSVKLGSNPSRASVRASSFRNNGSEGGGTQSFVNLKNLL